MWLSNHHDSNMEAFVFTITLFAALLVALGGIVVKVPIRAPLFPNRDSVALYFDAIMDLRFWRPPL